MEPDQRKEMVQEIRRLKQSGNPQDAVPIQIALDEDEFSLGEPKSIIEIVVAPKKSANVEAWQKFALRVSDIDPEIIKEASRNDVIGMLEANGLVGK